MTTETIDIRIREDGSRVVRRNIEDIGNSSKKSADGVDILKRALIGVGGYLAIDKVRQYADAWSAAAGRIRIATKDTREAALVTDALFKSAQNTRTSFDAMVELYSRAQRAGSDLGASQAQLIKFTEGVGKALSIQGTSTTEASGALLQLGQALTGAKIQAQEYNSLIDGAPVLLQAVARNLEGTGGTIGGLTRMVKDGQVSNKEFFDAFLAGSDQLDKDFAKSSTTIGQGFILIENAAKKYIGELDATLGVSQKFGQLARWVADNIDILAVGLLSLGAAVAVAFLPTAIVAFTNALRALFLMVAANPFTAFIALLAAAVVAIVAFKDEINVGVDDITTLGDVLTVLGNDAKDAFSGLAEIAGNAITGVRDYFTDATTEMSSANGQMTDSWIDQYAGFYADAGTGFAGFARGVARTFDAIGGLITGLGIAVYRAFAGIPGAIAEGFARVYNKVAQNIEDLINMAITGTNKLRSVVGLGMLEAVKLDRMKVDKDYFEKYGTSVASSINDGFASQGGALEKIVSGVFDRAQAVAKTRVANMKPEGGADSLNTPLGKGAKALEGDADADKKAKKLIEDMKSQLQSLVSSIAPVEAAIRDQAAAQKLLNDAQAAGLITADQNAKYQAMVTRYYQDAVNPLQALNRSYAEQTQLLSMNSRERQIQTQLMAATKDLQAQGVTLTQAETEALRGKIEALQKLNEMTQVQDALLAASVEKRNGFIMQLQAIQALMNDSSSGFTQTDAIDAMMQSGSGMGDLFAGTQEATDLKMEQLRIMYEQVEAMRQADLISHQTAEQMKAKIDAQYAEIRLSTAREFFGNFAILASSSNSKLAAIGKIAAVAQATIDGVTAVQKALASGPPPGNYIAAAGVALRTSANVARIMGVNTAFATGGSFVVGGDGGTDSQTVAFRATPGEKVTVGTPTQVRKGNPYGEDGGEASAPSSSGVRIVNLVDPGLLSSYMTSSEGERVVMNVIQRNASEMRTTLNM